VSLSGRCPECNAWVAKPNARSGIVVMPFKIANGLREAQRSATATHHRAFLRNLDVIALEPYSSRKACIGSRRDAERAGE